LCLQVANQHSDSIAVFRRDANSGLLTLSSTFATKGVVPQPTFAAVIPWEASFGSSAYSF
jgi:6-phosphogluconolactonase (cycloisomerase 2 family)